MLFREKTSSLRACLQTSTDWIKGHPEEEKRLDVALAGFSQERLAIPAIIKEYGFIAPWNYLFHEADQELDSVTGLLFVGMYKESFRSLRSFIEMMLLGLYYFNNEDLDDFKKWLSGEKNTPTRKFLSGFLIKTNPRIEKLNTATKWGERLGTFYNSLSKFVHTQGVGGSYKSLRNSNMLTFDEKSFRAVISALIESVELISEAFVLQFPMALYPVPFFEKFAFSGPAGGFMEEGDVELIKKLFPSDRYKLLKQIGYDEEVKTQIAWVDSQPDLTPEEVMMSLEKVLGDFPKQRNEVYELMREGKPEVAFALLGAVQKAFLAASMAMLNEEFLGVLDGKKVGR